MFLRLAFNKNIIKRDYPFLNNPNKALSCCLKTLSNTFCYNQFDSFLYNSVLLFLTNDDTAYKSIENRIVNTVANGKATQRFSMTSTHPNALCFGVNGV